MDTSHEYFTMAAGAAEIQKLWIPRRGDRVVIQDFNTAPGCPNTKTLRFIHESEVDTVCAIRCGARKIHGKLTWIPRQDQLQDMVDLAIDDAVLRFSEWAYNQPGFETLWNGERPVRILTTFEQLWMGYVMRLNHGKVWGGSIWVCVDGGGICKGPKEPKPQ